MACIRLLLVPGGMDTMLRYVCGCHGRVVRLAGSQTGSGSSVNVSHPHRRMHAQPMGPGGT